MTDIDELRTDSKYSHLNSMQLKAVVHDKGPLLILAGAGSGKTGVITHRIAYLIEKRGVDPYRIIALTFTNKAAKEMKERVERIVGEGSENIWVSTFHSTCVRILRRFIDTIGYDKGFTIYDSDDQKSLMKEVFKYLDIDSKRLKEKTVLNAISHAKDELVDPEGFAGSAGSDYIRTKIAQCYREYQRRLLQNNALDFDDLIFKTVELFRTNTEALEYYRRRFKYILVDEYQDTNTAQFELIRLLAKHTNENGETERNLCVVGDDDQSIYKFRGANIRNILDFEMTYKDTVVIRLEQNYRSTKNVLDVANAVIHNNVSRKDKTLWTENDKGDSVELNRFMSDREEADSVVGTIFSLQREGEYDYKDFAILYRTNAQSRSFEEKLIYRNIPYQIIGGQNFYQRKEIKDMLAYLRAFAGTGDSVAIKRIINVPRRGIGLASLDKVDEYAGEKGITFYQALKEAAFIPGLNRALSKIESFVAFVEIMKDKLKKGLSLTDMMEELLDSTGYFEYLAEEDDEEKCRERQENINELISKVARYLEDAQDNGETPSLGAFLDEVSLVADIDSLEGDENHVVLMTIHSAKGLEFPYVFMVGMEEGIFPGYMSISSDTPEDDIEEERRLCYVGMTRAMKHLSLSAASSRMQRGEIAYNAPSRFIKEIPRFLIKQKGDVHAPRVSDYERFPSKNTYDREQKIRSEQKTREYTAPTPVSRDFGSPFTELEYAVGDKVAHVKFGIGTVTNIVKGGRDYEVTVDFAVGTKKMLASFAKLKKV